MRLDRQPSSVNRQRATVGLYNLLMRNFPVILLLLAGLGCHAYTARQSFEKGCCKGHETGTPLPIPSASGTVFVGGEYKSCRDVAGTSQYPCADPVFREKFHRERGYAFVCGCEQKKCPCWDVHH
jgi:hypothetical protein